MKLRDKLRLLANLADHAKKNFGGDFVYVSGADLKLLVALAGFAEDASEELRRIRKNSLEDGTRSTLLFLHNRYMKLIESSLESANQNDHNGEDDT